MRDLGELFEEAPSVESYPEYHVKVKRIMDLKTIKKKVGESLRLSDGLAGLLAVWLGVYLSDGLLAVWLFVLACLYDCLPVSLFVCLPVCIMYYVCMYVCMYVCIPACPPVCVYVAVFCF